MTWEADLNKLAEQWPNGHQIETTEDAFSVTIDIEIGTPVKIGTHLFGDTLRIIPYDERDNATDADGRQIGRGDSIMADYFSPGSVGFAIKHHRPQHRTLDKDLSEKLMKDHLKLQDTHIGLVIGVEHEGHPGVIALNNPQNYRQGKFWEPDYPMIFFKIKYPEYLPEGYAKIFENNIRTMMAGFNAVSDFPYHYNGGDPLAVYNIPKLTEHCRNMMLAIAGNGKESARARAWFKKPEQLIYCSELAHISASAGLLFPLNAKTFEPLVGSAVWQGFAEMVNKHNAGEVTPFVKLNENKLVRHVRLALGPDDLSPFTQYAPEGISDMLAFQPMTMADIVFNAISAHFPRETLGERIGPVQAIALEKMKSGLFETMGIDQLPETAQPRIAVEQLMERITGVVKTNHGTYGAFRSALKPLLEEARKMTCPRPGTQNGKGYFVPPSLFHLVAQGKHKQGLIGLEYVGHGLHFSMLRQSNR